MHSPVHSDSHTHIKHNSSQHMDISHSLSLVSILEEAMVINEVENNSKAEI